MHLKPRIVIGYSRPDNPAWESNIIPHANEIYAVVLNPGDGPGAAMDPAYGALCNQLRSVGVKIFGYLYTGTNLALRARGHPTVYGSRPLSELQADMDKWNLWYGLPLVFSEPLLLDGFFVDETANELSKFEYYLELSNRIKPSQGIFWNFGRPPLPGLVALRGSMCISERSQANVLAETYPAYVRQGVPESWLVIAHNVSRGPAGIARLVEKIKASGVGFYCLSAATGDEPEFGVETEIFLEADTDATPAPLPPVKPPSTSTENWSSQEIQKGLRAIGASTDATAADLVPLINAMVAENKNLKLGIAGLTNAQIVAEVGRRLP